MQWQSPRSNDDIDITSLHHAVPLTTSLVSSTFSAEPMGPEQHRHCRSEHAKQIIISWNQRNRFRCISLWDRICETHQNEYAWISLPWGHCGHCHPTYWKPCIFPRSVDVDVSRHGAFLRAMKAMMPSEASWLLKSCMESSCCESSWWFW